MNKPVLQPASPARDRLFFYSIHVLAVENLVHLALELLGYLLLLFLAQLVLRITEQVVVEIELLQLALRVEDVLLIDVHVDHVEQVLRLVRNVILDGADIVVDEQLMSGNVAGEAPHPVVQRHDVGIEGGDEIGQRLQRTDLAAGGHVDVRAERADAFVGMEFGIRMDGDMAFVELEDDVGGHRSRRFAEGALGNLHDGAFGDEQRDAGALRLVILLGRIEHMRSDDIRHMMKDVVETVGVVLLVDVSQVGLALLLVARVAYIVHVEAQRFGQVVEPVKGDDLLVGQFHPAILSFARLCQVIRTITPACKSLPSPPSCLCRGRQAARLSIAGYV
ncbi:hypothetical protein BN871_DC_00150 [Paenibacillus sp. P22]|nr:hypothetical protein BN871_DC_00150 [Paenibacillus sp. P22]